MIKSFEQQCRDWLLPLGFTPIYSNHPSEDVRQFDYIRDYVRIQCWSDCHARVLAEFWNRRNTGMHYSITSNYYSLWRNETLDILLKSHASIVAEKKRILKTSIFSQFKQLLSCRK